jgi:hypothetical protein
MYVYNYINRKLLVLLVDSRVRYFGDGANKVGEQLDYYETILKKCLMVYNAG